MAGREKRWVPWLLLWALGTPSAAQSRALLFVPSEPQVLTAWKGAGPLGRLDDQEAAVALPGSSSGLAVRKYLPLGALQAFWGDPLGKGDYTQPFVVGEIDALFVPGGFLGACPGRGRGLYFSVTRRRLPVFTGKGVANLGPADLFRWTREGRVQVFLSSSLLAKALGFQSPTLDVDAFCRDSKGDLFFSLALDEPFPKPKILDGDLCFLPAKALVYAPDGTVQDVLAGAAKVLAREADLDAWVAASGLASSQGLPLKKVGNLSCLALDPGGGTFLPPAQPSLGPFPNLLFGGSGKTWAMGLCTTAGKGGIASFGGLSLGSPRKTIGSHFGVESPRGGPSDSWVSALALCGPPSLEIQVEEEGGGRFLKPVSKLVFHWGGLAPGRAAFLLLTPGPSTAGKAFSSFFLPGTTLGGPWEFFWEGGPVFPLALGLSGKEGRGKTTLVLPSSFSGPLLLTGQAFGPLGGGKLDLSLPLVLQWW